jgi:hypothetical protein
MQLNSDQERVVINALYTAAEKYRECAKEIDKSDMHVDARCNLVIQFVKQAKDCSELAEKLES